jgi:hypothetical protein
LNSFCLFFGNFFLHWAGSCVHEVLSFFQAEASEGFDYFDNIEFASASVFEDDVKLCLSDDFFSSSAATTTLAPSLEQQQLAQCHTQTSEYQRVP